MLCTGGCSQCASSILPSLILIYLFKNLGNVYTAFSPAVTKDTDSGWGRFLQRWSQVLCDAGGRPLIAGGVILDGEPEKGKRDTAPCLATGLILRSKMLSSIISSTSQYKKSNLWDVSSIAHQHKSPSVLLVTQRNASTNYRSRHKNPPGASRERIGEEKPRVKYKTAPWSDIAATWGDLILLLLFLNSLLIMYLGLFLYSSTCVQPAVQPGPGKNSGVSVGGRNGTAHSEVFRAEGMRMEPPLCTTWVKQTVNLHHTDKSYLLHTSSSTAHLCRLLSYSKEATWNFPPWLGKNN